MPSHLQGLSTLKDIAGGHFISPDTDYLNVRSMLQFSCIDCNRTFETTPFLYTKSKDGKRCVGCKQRLKVNSTDSRTAFIKSCKEKHGNYYNYELIPETFNMKDQITVICPKHGRFDTTGDSHKNKGTGCNRCGIEHTTNVLKSNTSEFITKANEIHLSRYIYSLVEYTNAKTIVDIICPKHGAFKQTPDVHLRGSGCPSCMITSAPIRQILDILDTYQIKYIPEKTFDGCVGDDKLLRFDIFVPSKNLCIEYDGPQHYKPVKFGSMSDEDAKVALNKQQRYDQIKNDFCNINNIDLIRIPYTNPNPDATVIRYILNMDDVRYMYSWNNLDNDIISIVNYIKTFNYDKFAIYGLMRGGLAFAVPVSYYFDQSSEFGIIKFQRFDGEDKKATIVLPHASTKEHRNYPIFVIDDLTSSGITMVNAVKLLKHTYKKASIHPIVIFGNDNDQDIHFIHEHPKMWIEFPYER